MRYELRRNRRRGRWEVWCLPAGRWAFLLDHYLRRSEALRELARCRRPLPT